MPIATLSTKGRITIPAAVRSALGARAGDQFCFVQIEPGRFEIVAATQSVTALKGWLRLPVVPVTLEDMDKAMAMQSICTK